MAAFFCPEVLPGAAQEQEIPGLCAGVSNSQSDSGSLLSGKSGFGTKKRCDGGFYAHFGTCLNE
jgi:hypothetical protein